MVLSAADRFGDAEAVVDGPLRLTFTEVVDRIRCAAGAFAELGIDKGDRVAVWAPNSAEWMIAAFGLLTAGGVLVPVNTRFKAEEAADIIGRSGAKAVLVQKGFLGLDYTAPAGVPVIDLKSDFLSSGSPFSDVEVSGTDISDIIYTSGTTGRPKGVMMNHLPEPAAVRGMVRAGRPARGRSLPDGQPVLPHLRVQGRADRVLHPRRDDGAGRRCSTSTGWWN